MFLPGLEPTQNGFIMSGIVLALRSHVLRLDTDASHFVWAFGAIHSTTWCVSSNSAQRGHSAWSCSFRCCDTFPIRAKPANYLGIPSCLFRPKRLIATWPASQSMFLMRFGGICCRSLQCSRIVSNRAWLCSFCLSQDATLQVPVHNIHPKVDGG